MRQCQSCTTQHSVFRFHRHSMKPPHRIFLLVDAAQFIFSQGKTRRSMAHVKLSRESGLDSPWRVANKKKKIHISHTFFSWEKKQQDETRSRVSLGKMERFKCTTLSRLYFSRRVQGARWVVSELTEDFTLFIQYFI